MIDQINIHAAESSFGQNEVDIILSIFYQMRYRTIDYESDNYRFFYHKNQLIEPYIDCTQFKTLFLF